MTDQNHSLQNITDEELVAQERAQIEAIGTADETDVFALAFGYQAITRERSRREFVRMVEEPVLVEVAQVELPVEELELQVEEAPIVEAPKAPKAPALIAPKRTRRPKAQQLEIAPLETELF